MSPEPTSADHRTPGHDRPGHEGPGHEGPGRAVPGPAGEAPPERPGDPCWYGAAADMTDRLHRDGLLYDRRLYGVLTTVPRHLLVPGREHGRPDRGELAARYGVAAVEEMPDGRVRERGPDPDPAVLAWVLGLLGRRDRPLRVLQVGIGHGYLTGLLCADHGAGQVVVVEADAVRAQATGAVLRDLGWSPRICAPGELGDPGASGLFDGVLLVEQVPPAAHEIVDHLAWLRYLMPGGRLVAGPGYQDDGSRWVRLAEHGPGGQVHSRWVEDPYPLSVPLRLALAHLAAHPPLADRLRATHVPGPGGVCRACETCHGVPGRAPCPTRLLADTAHAATVTLPPLLTSPAPPPLNPAGRHN